MIVNSFVNLISTKPAESYIRPEFTETGPIAIEKGRHPVLEGTIAEEFVANNAFISEASNTMIVTGPNMSGKSTYLRQVVLITIMAHIGCYVPARFASFRIVDHIFTRIGTSDNIELNSSTFMTEMRETAYLLNNLTSRSLVVVDELGRATSTGDGFAIAWSCCEYMLSFKAYVLFATHMQRLTELSSVYPNVRICYFDVSILNNRLDFKFLLREGFTNVAHYGIRLAEVAGIPASVVNHARIIAAKIDAKEKTNVSISHAKYGYLRKDYHVAQKLLCLQYANLSEDNLRAYLKNLQQSYVENRLG
ncbi:hypothetical protein KC19_6G071200 [Ceratodon purpureus]|uniref:DNA mismatch repair proteins mutS family domain-containing protein n=1 Tax=Ceratodon purpureus TaxID=3225 RepID=A0A8T0HBE9_CERPU|nr:hypothetical protein KC19_6G071200 [Ceratodon purpureus]